MGLDFDYRPKNLSEVHGNKVLKSALGALLKKPKKDIPHVWLFTGPKGCGKTSLGRIVSTTLKCDKFEFHEIDSAVYNKVEEARELTKQVHYPPMKGPVRVWFMDECHKLTSGAQEALLKTLEEPVSHAYFIFSTTDPQKLIKTFKDRCMTFEVKPLSTSEMITMLEDVVEGEDVEVPKEVLKRIASDTGGHPRAALKQLERIIDLPAKDMLESIQEIVEMESTVKDLITALLHKNTKWNEVAKILSTLTAEPETIRRSILGYCNSILLKGDNPRAWVIMDSFKDNTYDNGIAGITIAAYSVING